MANFTSVTKNLGGALKSSALDLVNNPNLIKGCIPVAAGVVTARAMHNDERPIASSVGGYVLGDGLATAAMIASGAMKYL